MNRRSFLQVLSTSALLSQIAPLRLISAVEADSAKGFGMRGLELSGSGFWQWRTIDRILELMQQLELNTLILAQDNLPNSIVWPRAYFSEDFMFARDPTHMTVSYSGRNYLRQVIRRARVKKIEVYLAAKEISYPHLIVELHPQVMETKGIVCPTHPFWWEFEQARFKEIAEALPDLAGWMLSAGTSGSELTFATRPCSCTRCRNYAPATWHENLIQSLYAPLQARGKRLVVRESSASPAEQAAIIEAARRVSSEIVVSVKNTPQDFCPTYPDNPILDQLAHQPAWLELDAMGQFAGLGAFPVGLTEDFSRRVAQARKKGVKGVWIRADIEALSDDSVLSSLNLSNLFAGAALLRGGEKAEAQGIRAWLDYGVAQPLRTESEQSSPQEVSSTAAEAFTAFLSASWAVMEKTAFVRGAPFTDGTGTLPHSIEAAFDNLTRLHTRATWDSGAAEKIEPTPENIAAILEEKREAVRLVKELSSLVPTAALGISKELNVSLQALCKLYDVYVNGFCGATAVCFHAWRTEKTKSADDIEKVRASVGELTSWAETARGILEEVKPAHSIRRLLDPNAGRRLVANAQEKIKEWEWLKKNAS